MKLRQPMGFLLQSVFAALALLSLGLALWQWLAACRFPLHRRVAEARFVPAISLLKPLKGADATTAESLQSWFLQGYEGPIQILFGVADAEDPAGKIVQELIVQNPGCDAQLVVCHELQGVNAKVAKLAQLEQKAKHEFILISDADVRVPPDFLANIVAPLTPSLSTSQGAPASRQRVPETRRRDGGTPGFWSATRECVRGILPPSDDGRAAEGRGRGEIGLVNCFYRLANPSTPAMQWEAIAVNADFWSQVLQSQTLRPLDFALGAVMLVRRETLAQIGGLQSLADCLADDYQLGHRIAQLGHRIALCPVVVECWDPPMNWCDVWKHQLRWARTIRVCQPMSYFLSILSNATLWPLLWLASELGKCSTLTVPGTPLDTFHAYEMKIALLDGAIFVLAALLIRMGFAQDLQRRFTPERRLISPFWLVPVKDLLQAALWFCAFTGNTVEWRGRKMKLRRDGTLESGATLQGRSNSLQGQPPF